MLVRKRDRDEVLEVTDQQALIDTKKGPKDEILEPTDQRVFIETKENRNILRAKE